MDRKIPPRSVDVIQDFASAGRIHIKNRPPISEGMGEIRKEQAVQTTPSVVQTITTGNICDITNKTKVPLHMRDKVDNKGEDSFKINLNHMKKINRE